MEAERPAGAQVSGWLQAAQSHVLDYLQEEAGEAEPQKLCEDVIRCLQVFCPQLPLSYSFTPVSQLLSLQKSPCVSALGWDTERFQQWRDEGLQQTKVRQPLPVLSRARLLLVGYISDRWTRDGPVHDGNLYIRDGSGCVPCEMSNLDLNLLGSLVLFPCWSYIPTQHGGGYVEVLSPPISVTTPAVRPEVPDPDTSLTPDEASQLLCSRSHPRGFRVSVVGQVASITSLINIRDKNFFFFFLKHSTKSVPVIVKVPQKLSWCHSLHVGDTYMVTSLSVSSLRGSMQQIFAVTPSSCLIVHPALSQPCSSSLPMEYSEELTPPFGGEEEQPEDSNPREKIRDGQQKRSKTLTYEGVVTRVQDANAGLYELDGSVLLCTAYTQLQNGGRGLRDGAHVQVYDAHLQQSPSPLFPTIVLSTCLRSRVRVFEFSHLSSLCPAYSGPGNLFLHLLFHYRLRLPEYLWVCDVVGKLQDKLRPPFLRQRCLTRLSGSSSQNITVKLLHSTLSSMSDGRCERDLHEEMVASPHNCPLQEYSPLPPPWCLPPLCDLASLVRQSRYLRRKECHQSVEWCQYCLSSEELSPPHVLLGVLHASSSGSLLLKDHSSSLTCLIVPNSPIAWTGCVLKVRQYQLVVETLNCKDKGNEERNRTYAVFLAADVTILHSPQSCPSCSAPAPPGPSPSKVRRVETSWARRLLLIESMEGILARPDQKAGLQFQAKASWLDVQEPTCRRQDGGQGAGPAKDGNKAPSKVLLLFTSSSVRWFPLLRPNRRYLMIASKETDAGIFDSLSRCCADMPLAPCCLKVPSDWMLEDVTQSEQSCDGQSCSIEEALKSSSSGCLVSVSGVVTSRSMCGTQSAQRKVRPQEPFLPPGVSIKLILTQPISEASVAVYLDVAQGLYPLGLLPGATVLMQGLERKVSRSGKTYLRTVPTTYMSVLSPPMEVSDSQASPPLVLFSQLTGRPLAQRAVCSVTCVLSLTLSWDCSMCYSTFIQGSCERSPFCTSQSGVFRAKARVKAEDGSGEVQLYLQDEAVCLLLAVPNSLWETLQKQVLSRGKVMARTRGRSELPSEEHSEDALVDHVTFLMSRPAVSRLLVVTFRQTDIGGGQTPAASQLARFMRGDREYVTRIPTPPTLTCLQLQEVEPRVLCHLIRERQSCDC